MTAQEIYKQRIEEAAIDHYATSYSPFDDPYEKSLQFELEYECFKAGATYALQNQWISVEEALPTENRIIARLSESFCGTKDCIEVLHFCERYGLTSPKGYYDLCGEEVPTNAITHWMSIPSLEGGEK